MVAAPLPLRGTSQTDKPSRNAPAPPTADPQTRAGGKLGSLQTAPRNSPITDVGWKWTIYLGMKAQAILSYIFPSKKNLFALQDVWRAYIGR